MKANGTWLKVLAVVVTVIMGLGLFILRGMAADVRENRKDTKEVRDTLHQMDKRTLLLEFQIKTVDGKVDMKEAMELFELFELLKKTDGP